MAAITIEVITTAGLEATYAAANAGGDTFVNDGYTFLHVKNGGGSDVTVTFTTPASFRGEPVADRAVVVTAGEERMIGPFNPEVFNNASGQVAVTYSGVTSVTVRAIRCKP